MTRTIFLPVLSLCLTVLSVRSSEAAALPEASGGTFVLTVAATPNCIAVDFCADTIHSEYCMLQSETDCDCRPQTGQCDRHTASMLYGAWIEGDSFRVTFEETPCLCKFQCLSSGASLECEDDEDCVKYFTIMYGCPETTIEYVWTTELCTSP